MKLKINTQYSKVLTYGHPDTRSSREKSYAYRHPNPNVINIRKPTIGYAIIDGKYYWFRRKYKGKKTYYFGPYNSLDEIYAYFNHNPYIKSDLSR